MSTEHISSKFKRFLKKHELHYDPKVANHLVWQFLEDEPLLYCKLIVPHDTNNTHIYEIGIKLTITKSDSFIPKEGDELKDFNILYPYESAMQFDGKSFEEVCDTLQWYEDKHAQIRLSLQSNM